MKDFIMAAFPWVLMGLALVIIFANYSRIKKQTDEKENNYSGEGMCLGMCFGVALSATGLFDLSIGISLGLLVGLVIGSYIKKKKIKM